MEFIKQTFSYNDISIEVNVSIEDKSIWLSQKEMAILFKCVKATISKWINAISKEAKISEINEDTFLENSGNKFPFSGGFVSIWETYYSF